MPWRQFVQAEQDARRKFGGCGSHAKASPAAKVVEEGLQGLVQDLVGGFSRMDVASARPMAGPGVQFLDVPALQGAFDIVGDSHPVGVGHELGGVGFGRLAQVRPGSEQFIEHGGFLGRGQSLQRRPLTAHVCSPWAACC